MAKPVTVYVIIELFGGYYQGIHFASADEERRDVKFFELIENELLNADFPACNSWSREEIQQYYLARLGHGDKAVFHRDKATARLPETGRGFRLPEIGGCGEEELDEYVIDCKLDEASAINNQGRDTQLEYLTGG